MNATFGLNKLTDAQIDAMVTMPTTVSPALAQTLLMQWAEEYKALAAAKKREEKLRRAVAAVYFTEAASKPDTEGTKNHDLGNGYKLKMTFKLNYSLDQSSIDAALDKIEKMGNDGKFIAERIVKWKADLSVSEYRELDPKFKTVIDGVLTTSPGLPSCEIVAPKDQR